MPATGGRPELFPALFALVGFSLTRGEFEVATEAGIKLLAVARRLRLGVVHSRKLRARGDPLLPRRISRGPGSTSSEASELINLRRTAPYAFSTCSIQEWVADGYLPWSCGYSATPIGPSGTARKPLP